MVLYRRDRQTIYDGEALHTELPFGVLHQKDGKIISAMCEDVSQEAIEEASKIKAFGEEVKINAIVDTFNPKREILTEETFEGTLLDALIYVHKTNKEK